MNVFLALFLLGLVQGLTEFLPVSSSGHLVLLSKLLGLEESLFLSVILHVATLFSIIAVFYKDIWKMIKHPFSKETMFVVVATIPTCIIVLLLLPIVKQSFAGGLLPICFAVSAVLLFLSSFFGNKKEKTYGKNNMDIKTAVFMGVAQGFAVFPGVSRSGATISAGLLKNKDKQEVAKFSFIMSIPIVVLSLITELFDMFTTGTSVQVPFSGIALAFVTAFVVGVFAIKIMIKLTTKANLKWFSIYLIMLSVLTICIL